jgi:hypothetical protein
VTKSPCRFGFIIDKQSIDEPWLRSQQVRVGGAQETKRERRTSRILIAASNITSHIQTLRLTGRLHLLSAKSRKRRRDTPTLVDR